MRRGAAGGGSGGRARVPFGAVFPVCCGAWAARSRAPRGRRGARGA
ncbi:hypothetical protein SGM_1926 [Streptomyces griseoaurantiacus M045]|uniref:Uncharacterized protein n=1 Tax=Streptomyces griseoaurantiacus M045 TaxID=996637 RepID=F3NFM7_9ACTN|nr:hypothetical protein SGM_1926 [Streptomyces griseoaurantiacus M045]